MGKGSSGLRSLRKLFSRSWVDRPSERKVRRSSELLREARGTPVLVAEGNESRSVLAVEAREGGASHSAETARRAFKIRKAAGGLLASCPCGWSYVMFGFDLREDTFMQDAHRLHPSCS